MMTLDVALQDLTPLFPFDQTKANKLLFEEEIMFALDVPAIAIPSESVAMVAQVDSSKAKPISFDYLLKDCWETQPTPNDPTSAVRGGSAASLLRNYYQSYGKKVDTSLIKVALLETAKNGDLQFEQVEEQGKFSSGFLYFPKPGYLGKDRAVFAAEYGGKRYKVVLDIVVSQAIVETGPSTCPEPQLIRLKKLIKTSGSDNADPILTNDLTAWQRSANLSAIIANAYQSLAGFTDLPGIALGQTTGEGATAAITLDQNAAGHGWYIDPTPLDSSNDYLPTSNPHGLASQRINWNLAPITSQPVDMLAQAQLPRADRIVKICKQWLDTGKSMGPAGDAIDVYNKWITTEPKRIPKHLRDLDALSVTMVKQPSFGTLKIEGNDTNGRNGYDYSPRAGFEGADQISFLVKLSNGKSVLVKYQMEYGYTGDTQKCYLKFGERLSSIDPLQLVDANSDYAAWQRNAQLSALIAAAQQTLTGFTDLSGSALGETVGERATAAITLDQNAEGHGWYIDPTPLDSSDDYLPTSNPRGLASQRINWNLTPISIAARSAAWYWSANNSKGAKPMRLNEKALTIQWGEKEVPDNQKPAFHQISAGVGNAAHPERWKNYTDDVQLVLNGGNPFENIRASLAAIGIASQGDTNNKDQFSVAVRPTQNPLAIGKSSQLLAQAFGTSALDTDVTDGFELTPEQELLLLSQAELRLNQLVQSTSEKEAMWIPDLKASQTLTIAALGLTAGLSATAASDAFAVGVCQTARQNFPAEIRPTSDGASYLQDFRKGLSKADNAFTGAKVSLLVKPKHGAVKLEEGQLAIDSSWYKYYPQAGFEGTDRFVMQVEKSGIKVKIYYVIKALDDVMATAGYCPKEFWKISQSGEPDGFTGDFAAWQRSANLSALIASAQQTLVGFTDLPGTALGQTTGAGATATITLDQNAAGHGWYIDPTPLDSSDDYLPTSNPEVWQAKAGSAAAGKMDMLSVLLHEYGHALGLEHSAEASNYMAASLQPGQRKLPSADELSLMARLVAELKGDGSGQQDPANPTNPFAPSPLSVLGLLPLGLMRRTGAGTQASQTTQTDYLTAINPTLTNGNFAAGQNGAVEQWETTGKVNIDSASSSTITLRIN